MSVRPRDGFFHIDFRWRGKRYRVSTGIPASTENEPFVKDWNAAIRREIAIGTFRIEAHFPKLVRENKERRTFKDDAEAWLSSHKNSWAEWTYRKFKNNLESRIFRKTFSTRITRELKPKDLRMLREELIEEGRRDGKKLSNRSVNKLMQPVKAVLLELFADGELAVSPIPQKLKLKEKRIEDIQPFTDDDLKKLFRAAHTRSYEHYEPLINFVFESGFRPEENYGMLWEHTHLTDQIIKIREVRTLGKQKTPKTECAERDADITPGMEKWLKKQKARSYLRSKHVWVTVTGKPIDTSNIVKELWKPLCEAARVKYRPIKQARHTWATRHISRGTDPRWMSNQMGTSLEMIFKTYTAAFNRAREGKGDAQALGRRHVYGHAKK